MDTPLITAHRAQFGDEVKTRVYIAGPITVGNLADNVRKATDAFWVLLRAGFAPFCPHWSCFAGMHVDCNIPDNIKAHGDEFCALGERLPNGSTHADWIGIDLPWVSVSDAVLRLPGTSKGADTEVELANRIGIPVFTTLAELLAILPPNVPDEDHA